MLLDDNCTAIKDYIEQQLRLSLFPHQLRPFMAYSLLSGGKRLRPLLVCLSARATSSYPPSRTYQLALPAALAIEYVHTYSLIHDDLPCMDNDCYRRGKLTSHLQFGEAAAVLTGDALLSDAFALLAKARHHPEKQIAELATAIGSQGMVAGQLLDLASQQAEPTSLEAWKHIHHLKTGRLFSAAAVLGGLSVHATCEQIHHLRCFGKAFGLLFQLVDDWDDNAPLMSLVGKEKIIEEMQTAFEEAHRHALSLGKEGNILLEWLNNQVELKNVFQCSIQ